tara:strand:- start:750 stop:1289 length:540 start_codon:yes stop_codon:yes gene_type:complete
MYNYYELGIIAFILLGIGYVLWKGGAANPVGTGKLQHDMKNARTEIATLGRKVGDIDKTVTAEKIRLDQFSERMSSIESEVEGVHIVVKGMSESMRTLTDDFRRHRENVDAKLAVLGTMDERIAANSRGVDRAMTYLQAIDERQDKMGEQIASTAVQCAATGRQVDRLYDHIVNKGMAS